MSSQSNSSVSNSVLSQLSRSPGDNSTVTDHKREHFKKSKTKWSPKQIGALLLLVALIGGSVYLYMYHKDTIQGKLGMGSSASVSHN